MKTRLAVVAAAFGLWIAQPAPVTASEVGPLPDLQPIFLSVPAPRTEAGIVAALKSEGYVVYDSSRTLLGRIKVVVGNGAYYRQIVISRTTGEIRNDTLLRGFDASAAASKMQAGKKRRAGQKSGKGKGNSGNGGGNNGGSNGGGNSGGGNGGGNGN